MQYTTQRRVQRNLNNSINKELFWNLMFRGSYDNNLSKSALSNEDYGIVTSLGFEF